MTLPDTSAMTALIGKRVNVLDQGWIELIDLMPHPQTGVSGDLAIINAARVSFLGETKGSEKDKKLLFYLLNHRHTSPFEQVEFKFRVRAPVVTWWQWVRHRTWCLSGDSEIYFDLPNGVEKKRRTLHKVKLKKLFEWWTEGTKSTFKLARKPLLLDKIDAEREYTIPELAKAVERREEDLRNLVRSNRLKAQKRDGRIFVRGQSWIEYGANAIRTWVSPMQKRIGAMKLRMCDESTGEIKHTRIVDVCKSGLRPVFEVTLENGYSLKMSKEHRILTEAGWMTLGQATELQISRLGNVTWKSDSSAFAVNGVPAYKDAEWLRERKSEGLNVSQMAQSAGVSYHTIRKYLKINQLQFTKQEAAVLSGKAQLGRKRAFKLRGKMSESARENFLQKHSGENSRFWKGGVTQDRVLIGAWTTNAAPRIHQKNDYKCVICGKSSPKLHAHHVDPVWNNPERAKDETNLVSVCPSCHRVLHNHNMELPFLKAWSDKTNFDVFVQELLSKHSKREWPENKHKPGGVRLLRHYSKIKNIRYCGEEMTYDLAVAGPYHNFVANGFIVHNSFNAQSGRYVPFEENDFYTPGVWRKQSPSNKQASLGELTPEEGQPFTEALLKHYEEGYALYKKAIEAGIAREQARVFLPGFAVYYTWVAKIDAHNLMNFLSLRMPEDAQYEIRVYAQAIYEHFFRPALPWSAEAFEKFVLKAGE